ncbi:hypothetical protein BCR39DRAFT_504227 [Naematelia encephala]|uniref:Uncharacterized protein n=1 Tax=Naematelia encephala TaxID=71784 RepID=A0A1Y2BDL3_9TREE|nr:hypothetical protein BCR39DRAFT_504227 [Naematelia encephala]
MRDQRDKLLRSNLRLQGAERTRRIDNHDLGQSLLGNLASYLSRTPSQAVDSQAAAAATAQSHINRFLNITAGLRNSRYTDYNWERSTWREMTLDQVTATRWDLYIPAQREHNLSWRVPVHIGEPQTEQMDFSTGPPSSIMIIDPPYPQESSNHDPLRYEPTSAARFYPAMMRNRDRSGGATHSIPQRNGNIPTRIPTEQMDPPTGRPRPIIFPSYSPGASGHVSLCNCQGCVTTTQEANSSPDPPTGRPRLIIFPSYSPGASGHVSLCNCQGCVTTTQEANASQLSYPSNPDSITRSRIREAVMDGERPALKGLVNTGSVLLSQEIFRQWHWEINAGVEVVHPTQGKRDVLSFQPGKRGDHLS